MSKVKGGFKKNMAMNRDNRLVWIRILVIVIIVLALVMVYFFVVQPGINKFVLNKQIEAANIVTTNIYTDMINQLQTNGYYQVNLGNQTLILVPYQPAQ